MTGLPPVNLGDIARRFAPAFIAAKSPTAAQRRVLVAVASCRTAVLGGHVYECDACGTPRVAYNSCRNRHCPSCLTHKSREWVDARSAELLPVPYFHVVFTVPEQVAKIALANKKLVYDILFKTSSETLQTIAKSEKHLGAEIGFLSVLHTWDQRLRHHPHVHCIVPGGGLSMEGDRWISSRSDFFLPVRVLSRLFRGKFLARLRAAFDAGDLRFSGTTEAFRELLRDCRDKEWVVYAKAPFGGPEQVLKYLARYTHRVAISNSRILAVDGDHVVFRYRSDAKTNRHTTMRLSGVDFLRRFLQHVLPKGFVRIRSFGFLANAHKREKLGLCRALLGAASDGAEPTTAPTQTGDEDLTLDDPNVCPHCGGEMIDIGELRPLRVRPWLLSIDTS